MKKTYYKISVLLLLPLLYYAVFTGFKTTVESSIKTEQHNLPSGPSSPKDFVNFILNSDYGDYSVPWAHHMENYLDKFRRELNFNGVHLYDADTGTNALGWFNKDIEGYQQTHMDNLITGAHNENLKAIYERSNISNLCYSQRLVYEVANGSGHTEVNEGFCWQNISGVYETEPDGTTSIHACVNPSECNTQNWDAIPQYICSNIYENLQHTDLPNFRPQKRDLWEWHLKPRMRIKQADFNINDTRPVVSIISISFDGTPVDTITIRINNFRNSSGNYDGEYKDIFTFTGPLDSLWVPGNETNGLNKGRHDRSWEWEDPNSPGRCKVDFKIYWHGLVDVWIDKLTVDDYRADKLFSTINNYDEFIRYFSSAYELIKLASMLKENEFRPSNYPAVNYVMNTMYDKIKYQAIPITLKTP